MVELASNPWHPQLHRLKEKSIASSGDDILFNIADILDEWPGTSTPTLYRPNSKERHDRLVKTIAGYPDIDVATRPLDWSLHSDSVKAMITSLSIDDFSGVDPKVSLRSAILNLDMTVRNKINRNEITSLAPIPKKSNQDIWTVLTAKCLGLLFAKVDSQRRAKEALLASLSSYDNNDGIQEIWRLSFGEEQRVPESKPVLDDLPKFDSKKLLADLRESGIDPSIEEHRERPEWVDYQTKKAEFDVLSKQNEDIKAELEWLKDFNNPDWEWEVTFQFYRVQQWMKGLLIHDKGRGTVQRVLRGASLILESVISEIRDLVMKRYGPGAIVIDGGGRLRVSVPGEREAKDLKEQMVIRYEKFLAPPQKTARRLERELECWWDSMEISELGLQDGEEGAHKRQLIKDFALNGLPARRVHYRRREKPDDENEVDIIAALKSWGEPPTNSNDDDPDCQCPKCQAVPEDYGETCPFLNAKLSAKKEEEGKWDAVDAWVFKKKSRMKEKYRLEVNPTHRLLYIIGHFQRMKDSVLHRPRRSQPVSTRCRWLSRWRKVEQKKFHETEIKTPRSVTALVKLDGNSVGHLFKMENMGDRVNNMSIRVDVVRRRSFRFNAHWWYALHSAMEGLDFDGGDPVGAWVVAGDDVLLAEYSHAGSPKEDILDSFLSNLSKQIDIGINVELMAARNTRQQLFSFAAGYTRKADHSEVQDADGRSQNRIDSLMKSVEELEHSAAEHWKHAIEFEKNEPWMVSEVKSVNSRPDSTEGEFIQEGSGKNYVCKGIAVSNIDIPADTEVEIEWPTEWDWQSLNTIQGKIQSEVMISHNHSALYKDENEMWIEILTRCESRNDKTVLLIKHEIIETEEEE